MRLRPERLGHIGYVRYILQRGDFIDDGAGAVLRQDILGIVAEFFGNFRVGQRGVRVAAIDGHAFFKHPAVAQRDDKMTGEIFRKAGGALGGFLVAHLAGHRQQIFPCGCCVR